MWHRIPPSFFFGGAEVDCVDSEITNGKVLRRVLQNHQLRTKACSEGDGKAMVSECYLSSGEIDLRQPRHDTSPVPNLRSNRP